eukprot:7031156-Alexandrium_andersonii.AAC.1
MEGAEQENGGADGSDVVVIGEMGIISGMEECMLLSESQPLAAGTKMGAFTFQSNGCISIAPPCLAMGVTAGYDGWRVARGARSSPSPPSTPPTSTPSSPAVGPLFCQL